jgi:large subunit ribosomal protein L18
MSTPDKKILARFKRKKRIRKHLSGTTEKPRLSVFRSSKHIYAQLIDDTCGETIASASSLDNILKEKPKFENKVSLASFVGEVLAERAMARGVKKIVFDRNGFLYHGRVKALSEGARKGGLIF